MVRGGSSPLGRTGEAPESQWVGGSVACTRTELPRDPLALRVLTPRRDSYDEARIREPARRTRRRASLIEQTERRAQIAYYGPRPGPHQRPRGGRPIGRPHAASPTTATLSSCTCTTRSAPRTAAG